jgi:hypothetical protein
MRTNLFLECGQIALFDRQSILDHPLSQIAGWVMCLDAGTVLKRYVLCPHCKEDYLFTLRAIAYNPELRCHGCGESIPLYEHVYDPLLSDVRNTLNEIDSAPASFVSARPANPMGGPRGVSGNGGDGGATNDQSGKRDS